MMTTADDMQQANCYHQECPARTVLSHVASRWGSLVLALLGHGEVLRFSQLRDRIGGISEKMLAQTLRDLERDGLVRRRSYPVVPPKVEYTLTPLGEGIGTHVLAIVDWINDHAIALAAAERDAPWPEGDTRGFERPPDAEGRPVSESAPAAARPRASRPSRRA